MWWYANEHQSRSVLGVSRVSSWLLCRHVLGIKLFGNVIVVLVWYINTFFYNTTKHLCNSHLTIIKPVAPPVYFCRRKKSPLFAAKIAGHNELSKCAYISSRRQRAHVTEKAVMPHDSAAVSKFPLHIVRACGGDQGSYVLHRNLCAEKYRFSTTKKTPPHHMLTSPACALFLFWVHLQEGLDVTTTDVLRRHGTYIPCPGTHDHQCLDVQDPLQPLAESFRPTVGRAARHPFPTCCDVNCTTTFKWEMYKPADDLIYTVKRYDRNTSRLARRSDEALGVHDLENSGAGRVKSGDNWLSDTPSSRYQVANPAECPPSPLFTSARAAKLLEEKKTTTLNYSLGFGRSDLFTKRFNQFITKREFNSVFSRRVKYSGRQRACVAFLVHCGPPIPVYARRIPAPHSAICERAGGGTARAPLNTGKPYTLRNCSSKLLHQCVRIVRECETSVVPFLHSLAKQSNAYNQSALHHDDSVTASVNISVLKDCFFRPSPHLAVENAEEMHASARLPALSSHVISTSEDLGAIPLGIEPVSPKFEASSLTTRPPRDAGDTTRSYKEEVGTLKWTWVSSGECSQFYVFLFLPDRGVVVVRLLASHLGEPGSIPGGVAPGFSHVGYRAGRCHRSAGFLGDIPFPPLLHTRLAFPPSALKTSMLRGLCSCASKVKKRGPSKSLHSLIYSPCSFAHDRVSSFVADSVGDQKTPQRFGHACSLVFVCMSPELRSVWWERGGQVLLTAVTGSGLSSNFPFDRGFHEGKGGNQQFDTTRHAENCDDDKSAQGLRGGGGEGVVTRTGGWLLATPQRSEIRHAHPFAYPCRWSAFPPDFSVASMFDTKYLIIPVSGTGTIEYVVTSHVSCMFVAVYVHVVRVLTFVPLFTDPVESPTRVILESGLEATFRAETTSVRARQAVFAAAVD
ncbi:hypothetical protein PR048_023953 [Dryococelus australis]|uniref:Uncharacterized protein n=1 Tax=Dryococelus australis TaxID=614101 RepID=A0ABQ9GVI1_9NEOP|nr:hypothetical protein PR048_023953 [Dryococelus australis]